MKHLQKHGISEDNDRGVGGKILIQQDILTMGMSKEKKRKVDSWVTEYIVASLSSFESVESARKN